MSLKKDILSTIKLIPNHVAEYRSEGGDFTAFITVSERTDMISLSIKNEKNIDMAQASAEWLLGEDLKEEPRFHADYHLSSFVLNKAYFASDNEFEAVKKGIELNTKVLDHVLLFLEAVNMIKGDMLTAYRDNFVTDFLKTSEEENKKYEEDVKKIIEKKKSFLKVTDQDVEADYAEIERHFDKKDASPFIMEINVFSQTVHQVQVLQVESKERALLLVDGVTKKKLESKQAILRRLKANWKRC